ncbi:MAG: S8 family serine peptidase, partial [Acidobacteria bacterium]|nr:S8 family serine peptidase [Acidobacteriota bacterium]
VNISDPAGAEKAITVANLADMSTVARGDDAINAGSCRGPRQSDGDGVTDDEEKPDLAAPGTAIRAPEFDTTSGYTDKTGTSMAAPHVAGCAALLLEKDPLITPTAMKSLLRRTASPGGGVPGWDPAWGEGSLDCFRAWQETVDRKTNLTFLGSCSSLPSPPIPPCWDHPAIKTFNPVIYANLPNTINARIVNAGPAPSGPFEVRLGVWYFGNGTGEEFVCSRQVANLDPGAAPLVVECPWTPKAAALPFPVLPVPIYIASLRATIVYANDTNPLDNKASRFRSYGATKSPFEATGLVVNSTFDDLTMNLSPTPACATATGACPGWSFSSSSTGFPLAAGDCPEPVRFTLEPVAPDASREATIHVAVSGFNPATGENVPQEGLTMSASLGCLARGLDFPLAPANRDRLRWAGESFFLECPRTFDLARGDLPIVPYPATNTGDFTGATCLADEIAAPEWDDPLVPAAGGGFWYAARAGGPIPGSWDEPAGSGMEGTRDATLASCP